MNPELAYPVISFDELEHLATGVCPCCGDPWSPLNQPELAARCHRGPIFVSYWESWLYLRCGEKDCERPIGRIRILEQ
jgi:hypothetical protein